MPGVSLRRPAQRPPSLRASCLSRRASAACCLCVGGRGADLGCPPHPGLLREWRGVLSDVHWLAARMLGAQRSDARLRAWLGWHAGATSEALYRARPLLAEAHASWRMLLEQLLRLKPVSLAGKLLCCVLV
jgi:hypothetical protein